MSGALIHGGPVDEATLKEIDSLKPSNVSPETERIMLAALSNTNDLKIEKYFGYDLG